MTRCSITCMEHGCNNKIYYTVKGGLDSSMDADIEVPLYCEKHRTMDGRHSKVRRLS